MWIPGTVICSSKDKCAFLMQRMCMPAGEDSGEAAQTAAVMRPDMDSFLQRGNLDGNSAVSKQTAVRPHTILPMALAAATSVVSFPQSVPALHAEPVLRCYSTALQSRTLRSLGMQLHKAVVRIQSRYRGYIIRKVPASSLETSPAQTPYHVSLDIIRCSRCRCTEDVAFGTGHKIRSAAALMGARTTSQHA